MADRLDLVMERAQRAIDRAKSLTGILARSGGGSVPEPLTAALEPTPGTSYPIHWPPGAAPVHMLRPNEEEEDVRMPLTLHGLLGEDLPDVLVVSLPLVDPLLSSLTLGDLSGEGRGSGDGVSPAAFPQEQDGVGSLEEAAASASRLRAFLTLRIASSRSLLLQLQEQQRRAEELSSRLAQLTGGPEMVGQHQQEAVVDLSSTLLQQQGAAGGLDLTTLQQQQQRQQVSTSQRVSMPFVRAAGPQEDPEGVGDATGSTDVRAQPGEEEEHPSGRQHSYSDSADVRAQPGEQEALRAASSSGRRHSYSDTAYLPLSSAAQGEDSSMSRALRGHQELEAAYGSPSGGRADLDPDLVDHLDPAEAYRAPGEGGVDGSLPAPVLVAAVPLLVVAQRLALLQQQQSNTLRQLLLLRLDQLR